MFKDVGKLEDAQNRLAVKRLIKEIGKPRNYGLTDEEKAEEERRAAEELIAKEAMEKAERERQEAVEMAEKMARWEEWVSACASAPVCGEGAAKPFSPALLPILLIEKYHGYTPNKFCLFCHMYHFLKDAHSLLLSYQ